MWFFNKNSFTYTVYVLSPLAILTLGHTAGTQAQEVVWPVSYQTESMETLSVGCQIEQFWRLFLFLWARSNFIIDNRIHTEQTESHRLEKLQINLYDPELGNAKFWRVTLKYCGEDIWWFRRGSYRLSKQKHVHTKALLENVDIGESHQTNCGHRPSVLRGSSLSVDKFW